MSIEEAIAVIRDPSARYEQCVHASGILGDCADTPLQYLVECLKRKGLPAELAAIKLYKRTRRRREDPSVYGVVLDADDWLTYLRAEKLIESSVVL